MRISLNEKTDNWNTKIRNIEVDQMENESKKKNKVREK